MGAGIAAHLANLGHRVTLLDLDEDSARAGLERARRAKPPHFYVPGSADGIRLGGIDTNLDWAGEADWVCEAIVENMDAKRDLFQRLEPVVGSDAFVSTNTSGLPISLLVEGLGKTMRRRLLGTHFFNPPRYLKLIELIPTEESDPAVVRAMTEFLEESVARRVVPAKDTPGFIANRFGMWSMFHAVHTAERLHFTLEQVDAITGPFLGRPRSASFRLNDLVGLDIMRDIGENLLARCPHDPHIETLRLPASMSFLLERGWIGEKVGQGYYRRQGKELLALDLDTLAYRNRREVDFPSLAELAKLPLGKRIAEALTLRDEVGEYLREHLVPVLRYAASVRAEVCHNVLDFDHVMMWGFAWDMGPFALIDAIGVDVLGIQGGPNYRGERVLASDDSYQAPREEPQFASLTDYPIVEEYENFRVRDLGDGVRAIAVTTKMGVCSPALNRELLHFLRSWHGPLVLASEAKGFSAGFDLKFLSECIGSEDWEAVDSALRDLQNLSLRMGEFQAVAALHGFALGGGFEVAMGCPVVAALAECRIGFPEAKVGLFPSGTGTARQRLYNQGDLKALAESAMLLTDGYVAPNADDARRVGYLRPTDVTVYHPDMLITRAKELALETKPRPLPEWSEIVGPLTGMIDRAQQELKSRGELTDYDETIGDKIKAVIAKSTSWDDALTRERSEFEELLRYALTQARIRHMLETGKPLRN